MKRVVASVCKIVVAASRLLLAEINSVVLKEADLKGEPIES